MKSAAIAALVRESALELDRALSHLNYSAQAVSGLDVEAMRAGVDEESLAQAEAFTSRFARVVDLLSKRLLRALDEYEMADPGTLLDVANRAEKRGIIDSVDWLREIKDTRNRIAHDYAGDRLLEILDYCRVELPKLVEVCQRAKAYADKQCGKGD